MATTLEEEENRNIKGGTLNIASQLFDISMELKKKWDAEDELISEG